VSARRRRGGLKFCPKCGSLMIPRVRNGRKELYCPKCGYTEPLEGESPYKIKVKIKHSPKERLVVVDKSQPPPDAVVVKGQVRCPKCGHDEVIVWMMQTRSADEPPTRFYRCLKCGYTWREYA